MPLPQPSEAATVRIYRFKAGQASSVPQGGRYQNGATREVLRRLAKHIWQEEIDALQAKAVAPAWVLSNELGPDLLVASLQHPAAGVLRTTIIAVEPVGS